MPIFFPGFAVRLTAMIDPAGIIAIDCAVNHFSILKAEEKCVKWIVRIGATAFYGLLCGDALTCIFSDATAGSYLSGSEYAVTMNFRVPDSNCGFGAGGEGNGLYGLIHLLSISKAPASSCGRCWLTFSKTSISID
jgi:hypothetical protein